MRFAPLAALFLAANLLSPAAVADAIPKDIGLAKQAIVNMSLATLWLQGGKNGIAKSNIPAAQKAKATATYAAAIAKATPGMQDKLAAREAAHFTSAQIADIERLSEVPGYQAILANTLQGKPAPEASTMAAEDQHTIAELGDKDYVKAFLQEVLNDKASLKVVTDTAIKSVARAR